MNYIDIDHNTLDKTSKNAAKFINFLGEPKARKTIIEAGNLETIIKNPLKPTLKKNQLKQPPIFPTITKNTPFSPHFFPTTPKSAKHPYISNFLAKIPHIPQPIPPFSISNLQLNESLFQNDAQLRNFCYATLPPFVAQLSNAPSFTPYRPY